MSILLIRHGETDGNRLRVVQLPEVPLNERGRAQALRLGERLEDLGIVRILASDLARARMTAEPIGERAGVEVELEPLLQERNFGDIRGHAYASFDFDPMGPDYEPPNGESWAAFHRRAARAWERVVAARREAAGPLAVVTHGLVCRAFSEHHLRLEAPLAAPERWGNTSLTEIEADLPWRVLRLNCTAHLDAGTADDASLVSGL
ncbi:MAG: histidine phosphatase family protein [Thermoanaerobaculia bacterium]|nr:histidine phosphatase family protein [Thermoanaerobaculia bacterium]